MTRQMSRREPLDLDDMTDAALRKNIFRELGRDLSHSIKNGYSTDTPGEIARLMEKAFKAGLLLGANPEFDPTQKDSKRPMTEMDVPSLPRQQLYMIRLALGIDVSGNRRTSPPTSSEALVLIMRPKHPGLPSTLSKDEWLIPFGYKMDGLSNKVVNPLIKLDLYRSPVDIGGGWKVTFMTEWGYELFTTGQTQGLEARKPGSSSTATEFQKLIGNDLNDLFRRAGRKLGVLNEEPEETPAPSRGR
jgi:hypothetical protein